MSYTLTEEQEAIKRAVLEDLESRQIITVGGYAGTGKTVLLRDLFETLERQGVECLVCTPTGKAAHVLKSKGVTNVKTIHSALYRLDGISYKTQTQERYDGAIVEQEVVHGMSWRWKGCGASVLLIDEGSMMSQHMYEDILESDMQCVVFGDHGQLPPVKQPKGLLMEEPDYRLETLHRNAGPLACFCEHLRKGGNPSDFSECEAVRSVKGCPDLYAKVEQVICARNRTRQRINRAVRNVLGYPEDEPVVEGERLISLMNSRYHSLFNGSQVVVDKVLKRNKLLVRHDGELTKVKYLPDLIGLVKQGEFDRREGHPFDWAYAITAHKAQGSEWDWVAVVDEPMPGCDRKKWRYTAASRTKERLFWVGSPE
jgi:exodeoxyribonuclease-5